VPSAYSKQLSCLNLCYWPLNLNNHIFYISFVILSCKVHPLVTSQWITHKTTFWPKAVTPFSTVIVRKSRLTSWKSAILDILFCVKTPKFNHMSHLLVCVWMWFHQMSVSQLAGVTNAKMLRYMCKWSVKDSVTLSMKQSDSEGLLPAASLCWCKVFQVFDFQGYAGHKQALQNTQVSLVHTVVQSLHIQ